MSIPSQSGDSRWYATTHDEYPENTMTFIGDTSTIPNSDIVITSSGSFVGIKDEAGVQIVLDEISKALPIITTEHNEIHKGKHFFLSGFETENSGGKISFGVNILSGSGNAHMLFEVEGTSQTEISAYEDTNFIGGLELTPVNNDRTSANTSSLYFYKDVGINDSGTLLFSQSRGLAGTPATKSDAAGIFKRDNELILAENKKYMFEVTSRDASNIITYYASWYEV